MAGRSHSLNKALRRRIAGWSGQRQGRGSGGEVSSPRGSGNQGLKALLVMLGVCLAGEVWGQDLQIAELGKIRENLR